MSYFTKQERDILQHRLDVPDAIVESITDEWDEAGEVNISTFSEEQVGGAIGVIEAMLNLDAKGDDTAFGQTDRHPFSPCEKAVLKNLVENSTWCAGGEAEEEDRYARNRRINEGLLAARIRKNQTAVERLAEKVSYLIGEPVNPSLS